MVEKLKIAENWLPRYTGTQIDEFGESILLTNFKDYVTAFAEKFEPALFSFKTLGSLA